MKQEQKQDFGDFKEIKEEKDTGKSKEQQQETQFISRVRMPKNNELIGIIVQRLGGNRMEVKTTDGKTRNCRVPGRYRRRLWLRPKDIIMIVPWEFDDKKGDIIYKYNSSEINQLKKREILSSLYTEF